MKWLRWNSTPFRLHSGGSSHWFVDGAMMFNDEHVRESVLAYWQEILGENLYRLVAIPTGGLAWAEALSKRTGLPWGTPDNVPVGEAPIAVVDDIVTTGASLSAVRYTDALVVVDRRRIAFDQVFAWAKIFLEREIS